MLTTVRFVEMSCPSHQLPRPSFTPLSPSSLCVWWQTGTSSAVITNLIRAEVRLMRKTEASTALLINSCPIMVAGLRHRAQNETFSFSFQPLSVLLPHSPPIMNSLLGPNYIQGCIRSAAGPVETSAEFPPHSPSSLPVTLLEMAFSWLNFECYTLPTNTPSPSVAPYLYQFWTHMWFLMETRDDVCLLLAVLHLVTAFTESAFVAVCWGRIKADCVPPTCFIVPWGHMIH